MLKSLWQRLFSQNRHRAARARHARLRLELLEDRLTPSDMKPPIISGTTLTLTKISGINDTITITNSGTFQEFKVVTSGGTNYTTPSRVTKIVLQLNSGDDTVILDGTNSNGVITLPGGLTITGTGGNKTIQATQVYLPGNAPLAISLGGTGSENTTFTDVNVGGAATINHPGSGNTTFTITTSTNNTTETNSWRSLSIANGTGSDVNTIQDTDFSGGVAINNGNGARSDTGLYGGSHTVFSALNNTGLLNVTGNLAISTATGQTDTEVYDYNVHGGLTLNAGNGIANQLNGNFIGLENKQTLAGSGLPVIGGNSTLSGAARVGSGGLNVDIGGTTGSDFPIVFHGNLTINTSAITTVSSAAVTTITLNDISAASGTTTSINLGSGNVLDTVNIFGDQATATLGSLNITSASGANTFNLQTQQGNLNFLGSAILTLNGGNNTVNVGSIANKGIVQTRGNFGVGGLAGFVATTAVNSTFGGLSFNFSGSASLTNTFTTTFTDDNVTGPAIINQKSTGTTSFTINTSSNNTNALNNWNSLAIADGTGSDTTTINDTDFSGSVSINNGAGAAGDTSQFGGSHTILSALKNKGLLTIGGSLAIATGTGQSDSEVYDYNVHGNVAINSGAGIRNQQLASFVGLENNQTTKGSGVPVIDGSVTITGTAVAGLGTGVRIDLGTGGAGGGSTSVNYPLNIQGNLTINATGTGSASIDANDLNVANGTTTITLGSTLGGTTSNDLVALQGSSVTSVYNNLNIISHATGNNVFNLQDAKGTMQVTGVANLLLGSGNDTVDLATDASHTGGVSGALLAFFSSKPSTFNGGTGINQLFASANTVFVMTPATVLNFA